MIRYKLLFTFLISSLFFAGTSSACGWDPSWDMDFYRFFKPELSDLEGFEAFQFTFDQLYDYEWETGGQQVDANLLDWQSYIGNNFSLDDLRSLIYGTTPAELKQWQLDNRMPASLQSLSIAKQVGKGKLKSFLPYLTLAKDCEPYNVAPNSWESSEVKLSSPQAPLVIDLQNGYRSCKSEFMKMRYAFQIVRLLHYGGFFQEAVEAYKSYALPLKSETGLMKYWTMSQYAGALHGLKRNIESSYYFSLVFDHCPSLRVSAWRGYDVKNQQEWDGVLGKCQSEGEKANLVFMRAISPEAVSMEEIQKIQSILPGSEKADLLLIREINKLEEKLLGLPYHRSSFPDEAEHFENTTELQNFKNLVHTTLASGQMADPGLWALADAYLDHLSGFPGSATRKLQALNLSGKANIQSRLLGLSIKIGRVKELSNSVVNSISKDLYNLQDELSEKQTEEIINFRDDCFSLAYFRAGRKGMALVARERLWQAEDKLDLDVLNDLIHFDKQKNKTLYEKELHKRLSDSYSPDMLQEMKGTLFFQKNMLDKAIAIFEQLPKEYQTESVSFNIGPDPFTSHIRDIINCDPGCIINKYTKLSLAKTLQNLQKKALAEPEKAGSYYHLLGNAYFNMSYFGASWKTITYHRTFYWDISEENPDLTLDLRQALRFYNKSMDKAQNMELAALSCLMAAKCEVVHFSNSPGDGFLYYDKLIEKYPGTQVYTRAMHECKYFSFYVNR